MSTVGRTRPGANTTHAGRLLFYLAGIHGALGDTDAAFDALETLYRSKDDRIVLLKHTILNPLRTDPRFLDLQRRMQLPTS